MSTRRSTLLQLGLGLGTGLATSALPGIVASAAAQSTHATAGATGASANLSQQLPLISTAPLGSVVARGWEHQRLPNEKPPNQFAIVSDPAAPPGSADPAHVLQVRSSASASTWVARTDIDANALPWLHWRWRVSHALAGSDLNRKDGDDYAARLYVFFDQPLDRLSFGDSLKIRAARALSGVDVPAAALCYVWGGTKQATGSSAWSPFTDVVRMIVMDSPPKSPADTWRSHTRNIHRDWADAFGGAMPRVNGVAIGADTDNTGETVEAWFGDLRFSTSRGISAPASGT
jgi:hypothetical protein